MQIIVSFHATFHYLCIKASHFTHFISNTNNCVIPHNISFLRQKVCHFTQHFIFSTQNHFILHNISFLMPGSASIHTTFHFLFKASDERFKNIFCNPHPFPFNVFPFKFEYFSIVCLFHLNKLVLN